MCNTLGTNSWTLEDAPLDGGIIYSRPLGHTELGFYWDSLFNGTADSVKHLEVGVFGEAAASIFAAPNVERAWLVMKRKFPLLGAQLREHIDRRHVHFTVSEDQLGRINLDELEFKEVSSEAEVQEFIFSLLNEPRRLSNELLARVSILPRTEKYQRQHVIFQSAHCITDGVSNYSFLRNFLNELVSPSLKGKWSLQERLALSIPCEDLFPSRKMTLARQRWRRAIANVIFQQKFKKLLNGHGLPRKFTSLTNITPAISNHITRTLAPGESSAIIHNCRRLGITFGNALYVLGQISMTRLLCQEYIRGNLSSEEWEYRKREPMIVGGPLNLRPFLDKQWYERGGATNVCTSISFFTFVQPFMSLGTASHLERGDRIPTFRELLTPGRFVLRSKLIRRQAMKVVEHPLFPEISAVNRPARVERARSTALTWINSQTKNQMRVPIPVPVQEQGGGAFVFSHGGSSFGNVDKLLPKIYPESNVEHANAGIRIYESETMLHCRPGELYLGSSMIHEKLRIVVFSDGNVYDKSTVAEWLDGVVEATRYYLGGGADLESPNCNKSHL
ncbi:hypothetical protein AMATHDRAFT_53176 [Amanita thiersii Skay4041]|uniref:Condensation domain-containing protein n=1 Tax=Amanita thiersii Skay4041 TaxID=703135 RepID=A0A2A9P0Y8_9AGAR|nr:hypothetical protein AMATHDRAFT_53176 [Amanita thiersii Skay4041]